MIRSTQSTMSLDLSFNKWEEEEEEEGKRDGLQNGSIICPLIRPDMARMPNPPARLFNVVNN